MKSRVNPSSPWKPRGLRAGIRSAIQVLRDLRCGEDVVARVLELPAQMVQIDIEQLPLPFAHLARDDHGLDVGAVHQRDDRSRHIVERRYVYRGVVEDRSEERRVGKECRSRWS